MFDNNNHFFNTLACSAILGVICTGANAGDSYNDGYIDQSADNRYRQPRHEVVEMLRSKCRRNGVVWSGGVASRFSGRISPRPVRSRWQHDGDSRIRCTGVDAFRQQRVSDQPFMR